jgi:MFS family permease
MLGISTSLVGIILGSYGFMQIVLRVPLSAVGSRSGNYKTIIICGLLGIVLSCAFPLVIGSWVGFLLTRALAGTASSTWIAYTAYLLEGAEDSANQRMGALLAANTGGCCIAQMVGTMVYGHAGMETLFAISIVAASIGFILVMLIPFKQRKTSGVHMPTVKDNIVAVLRNNNFWICAVMELIVQFLIYATILGFTGVFAQEALGVGSLGLGLIAIVCQLSSVAVSLVFEKLGRRRLPERSILSISFLLIAAYCIIMPYCGPIIIIIVQIIPGVGFGIGNIIPLANAGKELDDSQQLLSMGIFQTIYSLGMAAGPAIVGFIFEYTDNNYPFTFTALAFIAVTGAILTRIMYKNPTLK